MQDIKTVKFILCFCVLMMGVYCILNLLPVGNETEIYENTVRLHVIANSDSEDDQRLKLLVRDAVLEAVEKKGSADSKVQAVTNLSDMEEEIIEASEKVLRLEGCEDSVKIDFGKEKYPTRYYENFTLPSGTYTSLRVVIGEGEGKNWWCVLYPPLCTAASEGEAEEEFLAAGFSSEQYKLIKNNSGLKYKIRFRFLEVLSEAFGFEY
ncbi:MAG: stage II sporulation protein R [Ruminococcaceae bacterium]|nr:stage II sporulation protein R [Oscillospiraceae bacterium]